jgi:hypothetical protein
MSSIECLAFPAVPRLFPIEVEVVASHDLGGIKTTIDLSSSALLI